MYSRLILSQSNHVHPRHQWTSPQWKFCCIPPLMHSQEGTTRHCSGWEVSWALQNKPHSMAETQNYSVTTTLSQDEVDFVRILPTHPVIFWSRTLNLWTMLSHPLFTDHFTIASLEPSTLPLNILSILGHLGRLTIATSSTSRLSSHQDPPLKSTITWIICLVPGTAHRPPAFTHGPCLLEFGYILGTSRCDCYRNITEL